MELNSLQIEEFDEKGFLFFSDLFESNEIDFLKKHLKELYSRKGPEVVLERDGIGIRLIYGTHQYCEPFGRLTVLPRLLTPVQQLLQSKVYIHQSRLNPKNGFNGEVWNWH